MPPPTGALIVLEGAEGVGKSTQIELLAERIRLDGRDVVSVREPGSTPLGDEVRRVLLDSELNIEPRAEALLFMAARAQLVETVIRPALKGGSIVLADRFFLSTYAYQGMARGLEEGLVRMLNTVATNHLIPNLTIVLDLPMGEGFARRSATGTLDRIERSGDAFHRRVALAFREFAGSQWQQTHPEYGPIRIVSGAGNREEVASRVWEAMQTALNETFPTVRGSQ